MATRKLIINLKKTKVMEETIEKTAEVEKKPTVKYSQLKEDQRVLLVIGKKEEVPISRVVASSLNKMKPIFEKMENDFENNVMSKYGILLEDGTYQGKEHETGKVFPDGTKEKKRYDLTGGYSYDWVEVKEGFQDEFDKEVKKLMDTPIEFSYAKIKSTKEVSCLIPKEYDKNGKPEVFKYEKLLPIIDVLERKFNGNSLAWILENLIEIVD